MYIGAYPRSTNLIAQSQTSVYLDVRFVLSPFRKTYICTVLGPYSIAAVTNVYFITTAVFAGVSSQPKLARSFLQ